MSRNVHVRGASLLRLYPRPWRTRYEDEMLRVLEDRAIRSRDRIDLLRGALDAHLHPESRSVVPAIASLSAGALWTATALAHAAQPIQPDWPGYLMELVPLAISGIACLSIAIPGVWLRVGDRAGRFDRFSLVVAVAGTVAWIAALVAALLLLQYGAFTAVASTSAAVGEALVAVSLVRIGETAIGGLLAVAAVALVVPVSGSWLVFGLAWSAIGFLQWHAATGARTSGPDLGLA